MAAKTGELVNLALVPDHVGPKTKKVLHVISSVICILYAAILTKEGIGRMMVDRTFSPILHIPKKYFWLFLVIGGVSLILHFIENCIDTVTAKDEGGKKA